MASRPVLEAMAAAGEAARAPTGDAAAGGTAASDPRVARAAELRRALSPPELLRPDGSIEQSFFKPERVVVLDDKKWGPTERDLLYQGLERFGVGAWREISAALLPRWDETALRIKAARLLGSQSLARYPGWKGDRAAVDAEAARNRAAGEAAGCWKGGVLVDDGSGRVAAAFAELDAKEAAAKAAKAGGGDGGGDS